MRLFLSSIGLPNPAAYKELFEGKQDPKVGIIPNAWDTTPIEKSQPFLDSIARELMAIGMKVQLVDLRDYINKGEELEVLLADLDGIWVMGGNSFYLNWITLQAGLGGILVELFNRGTFVYGGESAGAVIAGTTLHGIEYLDNPKDAPSVLWQGLGLVNCGIIPHWGKGKYGEQLKRCFDKMQHHTKVVALTDNQYLLLNGKDLQILGG